MQLSISNIFPLISLLLALWAVALRRKDSRYKGGIAWFAGLAIALNILMFWISPWSYGASASAALSIVACILCIIFFIISLVKKNRLLTLYSVVIPVIVVIALFVDVFRYYDSNTPMYNSDDKQQTVAQTTDPYSESPEAATTAPIPDEDPYEVTYFNTDDTVYVTKTDAYMFNEDESYPLDQFTELHRTGISDNWCRVEAFGSEYYIETYNITTEDISEKTFAACYKTMRTNQNVYVYKYPSSNYEISPILSEIIQGYHVWVLSQSPIGWSKIEYTNINGETITGFVRSNCLTL